MRVTASDSNFDSQILFGKASNTVRDKKFVKPRISQQEQNVVNHLRLVRNLVHQNLNGQWFSHHDQVHFEFTHPRQQFQAAFPNCHRQAVTNVFNNGFHVKKFVHYTPDKTVTYIAKKFQIFYELDENLETYFRGAHHFIGRSSCRNGEIVGLEVAKHRRNQLYRCGFGSVLAYFCFIDNDHLTHQSGYQIEDQNRPNNPWNHPEMQALMTGATGFDNNVCKIIYIKYDDRYQNQPNVPAYTPHGSKAIIYAAHAEEYEHLVTYHPNPPCPDITQRVANVFEVQNVMERVTRAMPNNQAGNRGNRINEILMPYGNDWYFCKRQGAAGNLGPDGPGPQGPPLNQTLNQTIN